VNRAPRTVRLGSDDVQWHAPGRRSPIATSTVATSDLIRALAADGLTFNQAAAKIQYDPDAAVIVGLYVEREHSDTRMTDLGVR
jgi:hypothetical protein